MIPVKYMTIVPSQLVLNRILSPDQSLIFFSFIEISFCFPQKVFRRLNPCLDVKPEAIFNCLKALRPYHGILLLYETNELLGKNEQM